jgi:hypothetical protein
LDDDEDAVEELVADDELVPLDVELVELEALLEEGEYAVAEFRALALGDVDNVELLDDDEDAAKDALRLLVLEEAEERVAVMAVTETEPLPVPLPVLDLVANDSVADVLDV